MDHALPEPAPGGGTTRPTTAQVIDLDGPVRPERTRVVLERDLSPFERLGDDERRRLLVRVLCELVAYEVPEPAEHRLAG